METLGNRLGDFWLRVFDLVTRYLSLIEQTETFGLFGL